MFLRAIGLAGLFLAVSGFCGNAVFACSCIMPIGIIETQVGEAREQADIVFVGKVVSIVEAPPKEWEEDFEVEITDFEVVEVFKGDVGERISTEIETICCICGYVFYEEEEYLVYATKKGAGKYYVSTCSRTDFLARITKRELELLRRAKND